MEQVYCGMKILFDTSYTMHFAKRKLLRHPKHMRSGVIKNVLLYALRNTVRKVVFARTVLCRA